jgi:SAM-dependent methyltransferase
MAEEAGAYSPRWFTTFADTIDPAQTAAEVEFLSRQLPLSKFRCILDICCGTGRHADLLATLGHEVTGIDISEHALAKARQRLGRRARVFRHDMRQIEQLGGRFDAAILLWQSFGGFDDAANADIFRQIAGRLPVAGRLVLDIYNAMFFRSRLGTRVHERAGRTITETKWMSDARLRVQLEYGDGSYDLFDWRVFEPAEIVQLAGESNLQCILQCSDFDESQPPTSDRPRMQFVFERR